MPQDLDKSGNTTPWEKVYDGPSLGWVYDTNERARLTTTINLYVRKDGNDSNNGLANTAGGAFLTINRVLAAIYALDTGDWNINVTIGGPGTYTEDLEIGDLVGMVTGGVTISGDGSLPVIDGNIYCINGTPWQWKFTLLKLQNTTHIDGPDCVDADGGWVWLDTITWGVSSNGGHVNTHNGGIVWQSGNDTIVGGASAHWSAGSGGLCRHRGSTITITGTPNFSFAFAVGDNFGDLQIDGNTFVGSATGRRFFLQAGGRFKVNTQDLTYLPGNAAGIFDSGFYEGIMGCCYPITAIPTTQTGATYTVGQTDSSIIANRAGTVTLTLPTASNYSGRWLYVKTVQAQTVVSDASNVVPLNSTTPGTAILAATAGKWAAMQSDGGNWIIMAGA